MQSKGVYLTSHPKWVVDNLTKPSNLNGHNHVVTWFIPTKYILFPFLPQTLYGVQFIFVFIWLWIPNFEEPGFREKTRGKIKEYSFLGEEKKKVKGDCSRMVKEIQEFVAFPLFLSIIKIRVMYQHSNMNFSNFIMFG